MTAGKDCFFSIFICKMEDLEREFLFPVDEMKKLSDYMSDQMALGLMGEPSDLKIQYPAIQNYESHNDSWYIIEGEKEIVNMIDSSITIVYDGEKEGYCNISTQFSIAMNTPQMFLSYCFNTIPGTPSPYKPTTLNDGSETSAWIDPFSGHSITMKFNGTVIDTIIYEGQTILEDDSGYHVVDFHLNVKYGGERIRYLQDIPHLPNDKETAFEISGSNGAETVGGHVLVEPVSKILYHNLDGTPSGEKTTVRVSINVPDTVIPGLPIEFYCTLNDEGDFTKSFAGYSKIEDKKLLQVSYRIVNDGGLFTITGTVSQLSVTEDSKVISIDSYNVSMQGVTA